jgi:hypothetical protein
MSDNAVGCAQHFPTATAFGQHFVVGRHLDSAAGPLMMGIAHWTPVAPVSGGRGPQER